MDIELIPVPTPSNIQLNNGENRTTLERLGKSITSEFRSHKRWTQVCTVLLQGSPKSLFLYDRFEYCLSNAYGADYKIALNPLHILCYHPDCLKRSRCPVKLRHMFVLTEFMDHIQEHVDDIGLAMRMRFGAIVENMFATREELDKLSPAPFLINRNVELLVGTISFMNSYGIERVLHQFNHIEHFKEYWHNPNLPKPKNPNYVNHWKDILISMGIIKCSSLSFQEDDALIVNVLQFPDPVPDWSVWQTIFLYALKLLCSHSSSALHLHRGVTFNRLTLGPNKSLPTVEEFAANINHASPSVSTSEQQLPALQYENREFHPCEILYHIKTTHNSEKSFIFYFSPMVSRVPCCIQVDEQETNQGVFVKNGELYGLEKKVTVDDIKRIGLENFASYIAEENNYIIAVREYRIIDLGEIFCSNAFTSFESHPLSSTECRKDLDLVIQFAGSCSNCLLENKTCKILQMNQPCNNCAIEGTKCESLIIFHDLWDMGSSHKKTEKEYTNGLKLTSSASDMLDPTKYTIGFGGLHLAKALVNSARNHVMQFGGEHFGINILIALRYTSDLLLNMKNAIFVGKDRQSDLLAWSTVCENVQEALRQMKVYTLQRVPENYMPYKKNAGTHKKIIHGIDVCCNMNGDLFVLDAGSACLHVIDRSIVAIVYIVGNYNSPDTSPYPSTVTNKRNKLKFSRELRAFSMNLDDDLAILDAGREEVVIVKNCTLANKNSNFYILKVNGALSVAFTKKLFVLCKNTSGKVLQMLSFDLPSSKAVSCKFYLKFDIAMKIPWDNIGSIFAVPFKRCLGVMEQDHKLKILCYSKSKSNTTVDLNMKSYGKPSLSNDGCLVSIYDSKINVHQVKCDGRMATSSLVSTHSTKGVVTACCIKGRTVSATIKDQNSYAVVEFGPLDFAVNYTSAICKLYKAIGYIPPRSNKSARLTSFTECIENGEECAKFFGEMQREAEERLAGRKSFLGREGMPFSGTIHCLQVTVQSWKVLYERMEKIEEGSAAKICPHTLLSESYIEHSFGNVKKTGQGHNQTMDEYIVSKRRVTYNFQLKMCQMPFWQHSREKLQDKGYQELESNGCTVSIKDLKEIFAFSEKNNTLHTSSTLCDDDEHLLRKAYLLAKSVPRQSNRSKWREQSGHQPNMLTEKVSSGVLLKDDLVFCHSVTNNDLMYLIVQQEVPLNDIANQIMVAEHGSESVFSISSEKLVLEKGQIFTVPSELYEINEDGTLQFLDIVEESIGRLHDAGIQQITDEDWALLLEERDTVMQAVGSVIEQEPVQLSSEVEAGLGPSGYQPKAKKKSSKRRRIAMDDEDDDDDIDANICFEKQSVDVGDWVLIKHDGEPLVGNVEQANPEQGFLLQILVNFNDSNFFKRGADQNNWYKNIHLIISAPEPANNRGALKLSDADYDKYKTLKC